MEPRDCDTCLKVLVTSKSLPFSWRRDHVCWCGTLHSQQLCISPLHLFLGLAQLLWKAQCFTPIHLLCFMFIPKKNAMAPKYDEYYTNLEIRAFEVYGEISIIEQKYKEMRFGYKEMKSFSMYKVTRHKPTTTNLLWIVFFLIYKNKIYLKLKIKRLEANFSPFLKMSYPKQILAKKQQHLNFKQEATQLLYVGPISVTYIMFLKRITLEFGSRFLFK